MIYYCKLNEKDDNSELTGWQGPFETISPQAAASQWIKREWDCRHHELIQVKVRDKEGQVLIVGLRVRVTLTLEHNLGPFLKAA
ncbi:hypothetical protein C4J81_03660 [Deltaproteobacteria bacterium Smac51]|nr:hypothetical protein C4J81_03660 [Deltaproteobacteria bacterium Smac51]